jgi:transcriptional regulator with XRE-family HTH domain
VDLQGEHFGARVRRLREEREIGLRPFARMIGFSATYLSKIERGELPPPAEERIKEIARLLDQNADELLALAGKVASDVREIIKEQPQAMASFLRTARGLGPDELRRLEEEVQMRKSGT